MNRLFNKLPFILLAAMAVTIGVTTFIEAKAGTPFVLKNIYGAPWFYTLWCAIALSSIVLIFRRKMWKQSVVFLVHLSFLVILVGALTTALTSKKGMLHLRLETPVKSFFVENKGIEPLPFVITLKSFKIEYYSGTTAPSDYVSKFTCKLLDSKNEESAAVSMNNIYRIDGYRLYQSSYDDDLKGSWLTVNYDPYGTTITYIGYALLALSVLLMLLTRAGQLKKLLNSPALHRNAVCVLLALFVAPVVSNAKNQSVSAIKLEQAESFKSKQVMYNDRVVPLNTLANDFVQKITGKSSFGGLTSEQVLISWMLCPEEWQHIEMIKIKSSQLRNYLGITTEYAKFEDFFDSEGKYRLEELYKAEQGKHSKLEKAIEEADEKVGIILMLTQGELIKPVPDDGSVRRLTDTEVKAELLYNAIPFSKIMFMANLTIGILLFVLMMIRLLNSGMQRKELSEKNRSLKEDIIGVSLKVAPYILYIATLFQLFSFVLRWYISGTVPLSNGYETMQFVALATLVIASCLHRKFPFIMPFGFILSGFTLLVSHLSQMNPQITPLMPVLQSPWLSSHVSMIMMSYSLYAFMMMNGIVALVLISKKGHDDQVETLTVVSKIMLYPATFLLAVGIFLGAIWANVSWGSYWSWDPKEVWALITMIVYSMGFHTSSLRFLRNNKYFNIFMVVSFLTIIMTYFGVNYVLGGMHSYAG